jgi:proton glutamate symport protein
MKFSLRKIPLHQKILLALILGALFGALFNVSKYKLEISYREGGEGKSTVVEGWQRIEFSKDTLSPPMATFGSEDQLKLLQWYRGLENKERSALRMQVFLDDHGRKVVRQFANVESIEKVKTLAVLIKPIGSLFIRLLMFIAIPLVLASLIVGAASLGDIRKVGRIGGKTLLLYLITTAIAITIGLSLANIVKPGFRLSADSSEKLMVEFQTDIRAKIQQKTSVNLVDMVINIVPTNPINAIANGDMLPIVFFAVMVGLTLTLVKKEKAAPVVSFFDGLSDTMIQMVDLIMKIAPYGVFALIAATVGEFGFDILETLIWYAATLIVGLILHLLLVYGVFLKFLAKVNPLKFFRGMRDAMLIAFSSSSSAATLPVNMECCERNLGVPKQITSFVLPLGATINMDGTSMYQAVAAVFISQVYGHDLTLPEQLTVLLTATLASIGTAPVPGVGIIMLIIVLRSINVPEEGIALILGIDRILDMCRTVLNITGDAAVATVVAKSEGVLGELPAGASS